MKDIVDKLQDSLEYEFNLSFSERKQLLELIEKKDKEILQLNLDKNELMKTGFECCDKVRDLYKSRIDKAIEYLTSTTHFVLEYDKPFRKLSKYEEQYEKREEDLLNILKGEDK